MFKQIFLASVLSIALLILAACGDNSTHTNTITTVKVALSGNLAGQAISGAGFTMTLPANVTPAMTGGTTVAISVVTPSGTFAGSTLAPIVTYSPAVGATPGSLQIIVPSSVPAGVTIVGEVATITLQLANGANPTIADFSVNSVSVTNTFDAPITGMSALVSAVTLQ
jgi:hypothetical protein